MSWQACSWAGQQTAGNQGRKGLLLVLGNHANPSGVAWPGRGTLAADCECRPATITSQLAALEAAGLLARVRRMRANGSRTTDYLVLGPNAQDRGAMLDVVHGETEDAVADLARQGADTEPRLGAVDGSLGSVDIPPLGYAGGGDQRQSGNTVSRDGQRASTPKKSPPPDGPPDGFPDELRPHANAVLSLLREAAVERGAKAVTVRAVGRAVMDHPRKPLVAAAQSMRAWLLDGNGASAPCKDVVMRYRRWVGGEQDLAAPERLDAAGHPTASRGGAPDVASGRGSSSALARAMARDREQAEMRRRQAEADRGAA